MTGKRIVFTGGTGKAGRHAVPHLMAKGYTVLNVDLKPFDHPDDILPVPPESLDAVIIDMNYHDMVGRGYDRAKINAAGGLELFHNQSSGVLTSTVWGDGVIDNPPGQAIVAGDMGRFISFSELLH